MDVLIPEVREEVPGFTWEWIIWIGEPGTWEFDHGSGFSTKEEAEQDLNAAVLELRERTSVR